MQGAGLASPGCRCRPALSSPALTAATGGGKAGMAAWVSEMEACAEVMEACCADTDAPDTPLSAPALAVPMAVAAALQALLSVVTVRLAL